MARSTESFIRRIEDLFGDIYAADEVQVWLETPQAALDGKRPIELIESGQGDVVVKAVNEIVDGILV